MRATQILTFHDQEVSVHVRPDRVERGPRCLRSHRKRQRALQPPHCGILPGGCMLLLTWKGTSGERGCGRSSKNGRLGAAPGGASFVQYATNTRQRQDGCRPCLIKTTSKRHPSLHQQKERSRKSEKGTRPEPRVFTVGSEDRPCRADPAQDPRDSAGVSAGKGPGSCSPPP